MQATRWLKSSFVVNTEVTGCQHAWIVQKASEEQKGHARDLLQSRLRSVRTGMVFTVVVTVVLAHDRDHLLPGVPARKRISLVKYCSLPLAIQMCQI